MFLLQIKTLKGNKNALKLENFIILNSKFNFIQIYFSHKAAKNSIYAKYSSTYGTSLTKMNDFSNFCQMQSIRMKIVWGNRFVRRALRMPGKQ